MKYTIGKLAKLTNTSIQTLRFYDRKGILKPNAKSLAGYRLYDQKNLKQLLFIQQAKQLGFSLKEIKELLSLSTFSSTSCQKVKKKTEQKLKQIQEKIKALKDLEKKLKKLILLCQKKSPPNYCPILDEIKTGGEKHETP